MLVQVVLFDGLGLLDAIAPYEVLTAAGLNSGGGMAVEFVSTAGARAVPSGPGDCRSRPAAPRTWTGPASS